MTTRRRMTLTKRAKDLSPKMASVQRLLAARAKLPKILNSRTFSSKEIIVQRDFDDVETHTGQTFPENDFRLARFEGKSKLVNTQFAINLIAEAPPTGVKDRWVWCEGGGGPLGHPKIFINLDQPGNHSCGYCGLRFYQDASHGSH